MSSRIALIDDDHAARRMLRRVLERRGYAVIDAEDGETGLALVRAEHPDAVLLDLRMPGALSGIDVAREIRADAGIAGIPIIVVSASTHMDARELVEQIGCDAFVEKPVDFDELEVTLTRLLE
jgi:DNA-binding response OmpR family regulator